MSRIVFVTPDGREVASARTLDMKGFTEQTEVPNWGATNIVTPSMSGDMIAEVDDFRAPTDPQVQLMLDAAANKLAEHERTVTGMKLIISCLVHMMGGVVLISRAEMEQWDHGTLSVEETLDGTKISVVKEDPA